MEKELGGEAVRIGRQQEWRPEILSSIRRRELSSEAWETAAEVGEQLEARLMMGFEVRRRQKE